MSARRWINQDVKLTCVVFSPGKPEDSRLSGILSQLQFKGGQEIPAQLQSILSNRKIRKTFLFLLVLLGIVVAGSIFWHKTMYHFKTVAPGKLYRSGTLSIAGLKIAHALYGIKTIVNLRSEDEMKGDWYKREKDFARANHIRLVDIPMIVDTPPGPEQIDEFLNVMTDSGMQPVLVHCEMGVMRTGMMVAVYRISILKEPNDKVIEELAMFGRSFRRRPAVEEFILNYSP